MKMYHINPKVRKVTVIDYNGEYEEMRPHLPYPFLDGTRINREKDYLFLNDTGWVDDTWEKECGFTLLLDDGQWHLYIGQALLFGSGPGGENADPHWSLDQLLARLAYPTPRQLVSAKAKENK